MKQQGKAEVTGQVAFVNFIENDDAHIGKIGVAL
jgi:hypothetical protein